jgi:GTPase SAR1 family protein
MPTRFSDREIAATLIAKFGADKNRFQYDNKDNLIQLNLSQLALSEVPSEISLLTNLRRLDLSGNQLTHLPAEIGQLTNLHGLRLSESELTQLPAEIGQLTSLQWLSFSEGKLSQIPPEIGQLANLEELRLDGNQLTQLPAEIGQLTNLHDLYLDDNQLTQLPAEMGQLTLLQFLSIDNISSLLTPPPEIVTLGTASILSFLQELQKNSAIRYEAKLLVVGEGGTGKSSLLRALRNEVFDPDFPTTHGIAIDQLTLPHPQRSQTELRLNTWDFGGQHIYQATHQFFLTRLYLVVWNARLGAEQGRLNFWLDTIQALAPDAPVILVATHADERMPDLNYQLYQDAYPQLVGTFSVSNKNRTGLSELQTALAYHAAALPLTGLPWPTNWVEVEKALMARQEHHIDAKRYTHICATRKIQAKIAQGTLGSYLHDLGKILYFRDDYVLSNMVVLKPNWVTKAISLVLEDESTREVKGILAHSELARIWAVDEDGRPYSPELYPVFLRLMERFDLSYQIETDMPGKHPTHSLVPQLLPHQPPPHLPPWPAVPAQGQVQVEMVYRFDFVPAGIMSWFIVRTHRYTQHVHWREGLVLAYQDHHARVELNPLLRELRLVAWGVQPYNFFTILKNTLDLILARFEGLRIRREVPCICHWETPSAVPCKEVYRYEEDLVRRMEAGKQTIECPASYKDVSVPKLLYGIHISTDVQVMVDIQVGQQEALRRLATLQHTDDLLLRKLDQQSELIARNFTRLWNLEMHKIEAECPNTFFLIPGKHRPFNPKNWVSHDYQVFLMCQHPPGSHCVGDGYELRKSREWWTTVSPWLKHLITFLKFGVPMGHAIGAVVDGVDIKNMAAQIGLLEKITEDLAAIPALDSVDHVEQPHLSKEQLLGPALRALHSFLVEANPSQYWGGLHKTVIPDGNILWLCDTHRQQYEAKPLDVDFDSQLSRQGIDFIAYLE